MEKTKLIFFVARIALVLSRPIGQESGEKHEALTGENEIEGYDLGSDGKRVFQTEKPKSQIRFGYGLKFGYKGAALHGLNRYNLMVGLEIPDIRLAQFFRPQIPDQEFCERYNNPQYDSLYMVCSRTWPAYIESVRNIERYQDEMEEILYGDLPAVLPGFQVSDLGPNPWENNHYIYKIAEKTSQARTIRSVVMDYVVKGYKRVKRSIKKVYHRGKRFIADLIGLGIQGITSLLNHRKQGELKKGMRMLKNRHSQIQGRISVVENEMMSLTQTHLAEIKDYRDDIMVLGQRINALHQQLKGHEFDILTLKNNQIDTKKALEFLSNTISDLFGRMQRYLALYVQMHEKLNNLLDAIDDLEKGELSHRVIPHRELANMLKHVKKQIELHYPEYELVLEDTHNYYNLPLVVYAYEQGVLGIQIPVFLKPRLLLPLHLYSLRTVPVPFHMNEQEMEATESKYTYTKLIPSTEILGMSSDTNINLDNEMLEECYKIGTVYFCEVQFLTKYRGEHTCESAIFHYEHAKVIKRQCTFEYYPYLEPDPELLDAGNYFLLAHLPTPWSVDCKSTDQFPGPLEGSAYTIVMKFDMCGCEIQAGVGTIWHVQGNIDYCPEMQAMNADITFYYPINMAVMIYQNEEEINRLRITDNSLFVKPYPFDPEEDPKILDDEIPSVDLNKAMNQIGNMKYASKEDYAIAMTKPRNWINGQSPWFGFLLFGVIGTIILALVVIPWVMKTCSISDKIQKLTSGLTKVAAIQGVSPPMVTALEDKDLISLETQGGFGLLMITLYIVAVIFGLWLLKRILKYISRYYEMNNLSSIQTRKSWYNYMEFDKTHIYVQLQHPAQPVSMEIYMGTYFGNPESLLVRKNFEDLDLEFEPKWCFDYININWSNSSLAIKNLELQSPDFIQIPLLKKYLVRKMFSNEQVKFRLVAYNPSSCKIRALGEFKLCKVKIKGTHSPESLQHDKHEEPMHVLPKMKTEKSLQNWTSRVNLQTQTFEIGPVKPTMNRPQQLSYMPMYTSTFRIDTIPSPIAPSTNTSNSFTSQELPSPPKTLNAEVYV